MRLFRMRSAAILLAGTALILGACTDDSGEDTSDDSTGTPVPEVTAPTTGTPGETPNPGGGDIEPANPESPPEGTLASGSGSVKLGLGSYCWSPPTGSGEPGLCADAIGIITAPDDLTVEAGETLTIAGEAGTLPWPPMTIAHATLYTAPGDPVDSGSDFRAWRPQDTVSHGEIVLETSEEIGEHSIMLPDDLERGTYILSLSYTAGPDRGSDAMYGAVLSVE